VTQPFHTQNQSLKAFNTFGFDVVAHQYLPIESPEDLTALFQKHAFEKQPFGILGGGSNITFTQDFSGLLLHNRIQGRTIIEDNSDHVIVEFGGGENWHETVLYTLEYGWGGLENLSLIQKREKRTVFYHGGSIQIEQTTGDQNPIRRYSGHPRWLGDFRA